MQYTESQIRDATLRALLATPGHRLTTSQLIQKLSAELGPTGHDAEIAHSRSDTYFSQKVRNLVSHRNQSTGLQARGLADYDAATESWTLTKLGRRSAMNLYPAKRAL